MGWEKKPPEKKKRPSRGPEYPIPRHQLEMLTSNLHYVTHHPAVVSSTSAMAADPWAEPVGPPQGSWNNGSTVRARRGKGGGTRIASTRAITPRFSNVFFFRKSQNKKTRGVSADFFFFPPPSHAACSAPRPATTAPRHAKRKHGRNENTHLLKKTDIIPPLDAFPTDITKSR